MRRRHQGFTLVELLVVIAIIGTLMSIMLPAVQAVRESARNANCKANLRNVALALRQYHDTQKRFPAGADFHDATKPNTSTTDRKKFLGHSAFIHALPFLEERAMYDRYQFHLPAQDRENAEEVTKYQIPVMICPSDEASDRRLKFDNISEGLFAGRSNYAVSFGTNGMMKNSTANKLDFETDGAFRANKGRRVEDFYNGDTNTALASEILIGKIDESSSGDVDWRGTWAFGLPGASIYMHHDRPNRRRTQETGCKSSYDNNNLNKGDYCGDVMISKYCVDEPPDLPCDTSVTIDDEWQKMHVAARSRHTGSVNVAFADARVTSENNNVDLLVWRQLATIREAEFLGKSDVWPPKNP